MLTKVDLRTIKDNPMRDFRVDPIDEEQVQKLRASIRDSGFWSGLTARKRDGQIELAAGHTRLRAALAEGITHEYIAVGDMTDQEMIERYATENALQRGNDSTAVAGTVASTIRFLLKPIITGEGLDAIKGREGSGPDFRTRFDLTAIRRELNKDGIGEKILMWMLAGVEGISRNVVDQQLANLKQSGEYARITAEVYAEIEAEKQEEMRQAEEQARIQKEWEEEQARRAAERERKREQAEARRLKAEADRKARIEAEEKRRREAEEARKAAEAERKTAKEQADRDRAQKEAERRKAEAEAASLRIAEEKEQARIEAARQKELAKEQAAREAAEKAEADRQREALSKEAQKFESVAKIAEIGKGAVSSAAAKKVTFDYQGVARHLKVKEHVNAFRDVVTGIGVRPYLPLEAQAEWAKELVRRTTGKNTPELTGSFIRDETMMEYLFAKNGERTLSRREEEVKQHKDIIRKWNAKMDKFCTHLGGILGMGIEMKEMLDKHPGITFPISQKFRNDLDTAKRVIDTLIKKV